MRVESYIIFLSSQASLVDSQRHLASRHSLKVSNAEVYIFWGALIS